MIDGEIVFTAGTQSFTATIDSQQKYQVKLEPEAENITLPITAIAKGAGANQWVEFASVLPSSETLSALAGDDNALTEDEFLGVGITALTTAEYAEIKNNDLPLTSDLERKHALASLHPIRAVEQAAMVMRLLSDASIGLPSNKQTLLTYLLDAGVAETYLEILRVSDKAELDQHIAALQNDLFAVSANSLIGNFALESQHSNYLLTFKSDGTGNLKAASLSTDILSSGYDAKADTDFTWVRDESTLSITLTAPASYKLHHSFEDAHGQSHNCDHPETPEYELCDVTFNAIELDLVSESDIRYFASIQLDMTAKIDGSLVYQGATKSHVVRLMNLDSAPILAASELSGSEWVSANYSFDFSDDGKVIQKYLMDNTTQTLDWALSANKLEIGDTTIWLGPRNEAGASVFLVGDNHVGRTMLVKREPVSMTEADWIGRWSTYPKDVWSNAHDVNADKTFRDGFEAKAVSNWIADNHRQTAIVRTNWRIERDLLAIHNGKHYLSECQGFEQTPFIPMSCELSIELKSSDFSSITFWNYSSPSTFSEKTSGDVWMTNSGYSYLSSNASTNLTEYAYSKVSATTFFYPSKNLIVEMTGASQDEIEVCEYQLNQICNPVDKKTYVIGAEVQFTVIGDGSISHSLSFTNRNGDSQTLNREIGKAHMFPKYQSITLEVAPNPGSSIGPVTGCGGALTGDDGEEYKISELTEDCAITVTFNN